MIYEEVSLSSKGNLQRLQAFASVKILEFNILRLSADLGAKTGRKSQVTCIGTLKTLKNKLDGQNSLNLSYGKRRRKIKKSKRG